jgi:hypothetical protein
MPSSLNGNGVTFNDGTTQDTASNYIMRTYTAPATWTKPANLKAVKVTVVGGGGGGGGARGTANPTPSPYGATFVASPRTGGHGGGGGTSVEFIPAGSIPGPVAVTRGAGGTAGPATSTLGASSAGGAGGTSSFGSFLSATGGAGAVGSPTGNGSPGGQGSGSGGDLNIPGGQSTAIGRSGDKSNSFFSVNGVGPQPGAGNGSAGDVFGGGATGGLSTGAIPAPGTTSRSGGAGAAGIVIVEEFY